MKYYKISHKETGTVVGYVEEQSANSDEAADICNILGADEYISEEISKEEYQEAEGEAGVKLKEGAD